MAPATPRGLSKRPLKAATRTLHRRETLWTLAALLIAAMVVAPIGAVLVLAVTAQNTVWSHIVTHVLPATLATTLMLAVSVGTLTLAIGVGTAWLVTLYRFPGRALFDRLLVLPLAMPTYIVAYCYAEGLDYAGPVQTWMRAVFGWAGPQDYFFPEVRSLGGAILILSAVLYPYVYLTARASFAQQSVCVLEVARTLGRTPMGAFWAVALPMARPALAGGVALVIMECLNDLGAVQHLGVQTLSASIYATWLQRSDLGGATQLAMALLAIVLLLLVLERRARAAARVDHTSRRWRAIPFHDLQGWKAVAAGVLCALPVIAGFVIPVAILARHAWVHARESLDAGVFAAAANSILLAGIAALVAVGLGMVLAYARRVAGTPIVGCAVRATTLGYAVPGTVLAIGLLIPLAAFDNRLDALATQVFGLSTGLLFSGSLFAVTFAYVARFMAVGLSSLEAGLAKISPGLDAASRTLGETALSSFWRVHLPLLTPALAAAALLVFVDGMKELPATLLLRPFNFDTLATHIYGFASLEQFELAALGALAIVLAGLVPVLLLHEAVTHGRAGSQPSGSG